MGRKIVFPCEAIFFGSRLKGNAKIDSDVDIALEF